MHGPGKNVFCAQDSLNTFYEKILTPMLLYAVGQQSDTCWCAIAENHGAKHFYAGGRYGESKPKQSSCRAKKQRCNFKVTFDHHHGCPPRATRTRELRPRPRHAIGTVTVSSAMACLQLSPAWRHGTQKGDAEERVCISCTETGGSTPRRAQHDTVHTRSDVWVSEKNRLP